MSVAAVPATCPDVGPPDDPVRDRFRGAIVGLAVGDDVSGVPVLGPVSELAALRERGVVLAVNAIAGLRDGLERLGHAVTMVEPSPFRRFPCPGYREIELAWRPGAAEPSV